MKAGWFLEKDSTEIFEKPRSLWWVFGPISKMTKGMDILTQNFAKIADHLDCSMDYLLGRTDNSDTNK